MDHRLSRRTKGTELIIGSSQDRQFGPVILFGAGGILVEVFQDRALALPPLTTTLAHLLMERTKIHHALKGVRGQRPVDLDALAKLLVRFGQLVADFLEIAEVDINPLLASPDRIVALDARVLLLPPDAPKPRLAIRPYPNQYTARFRTDDGAELLIRALRPEDEPLLIAMHGRHSERTIRMRYFSLVKTLSRESLIRLCHLDYDRELALAALHRGDGGTQMVGVSRYYLDPETGEGEFAVVVEDAWQGRGVGRYLLERLVSIAKERGVKRLVGAVLRENTPMLGLTGELGFVPRPTKDDNVIEVVRELTS